MDVNKRWDYLIKNELFTSSELQLVTTIIGYSCETLDKICFSRYGYDFDGLVYENERGEL